MKYFFYSVIAICITAIVITVIVQVGIIEALLIGFGLSTIFVEMFK